MSAIGTLDWALVYLQIVCMVGLIVRELLKPKGKNLLLILVSATSLGLVQIQEFWVFQMFDRYGNRITHLTQTLEVDATKSACVLVTISVLAFCAVAYRMDQRPVTPANAGERVSGFIESPLSYTIIGSWVLLCGVLLTVLAGGLQSAVENPGQSIAGQTFLLILVSIGKIPLARKLALRRRISPIDVALYALTFLLLLFNSRFLAAYTVMQLAVVYHYRQKEASPRLILGLGTLLVVIFIVFGLYRDFSIQKRVLSAGTTSNQYIESVLTSGNEMDWFYAKNVEGFVGLAGIMTYEADTGNLEHDYGISDLALLPQLIPNSIRTDPDLPFKSMEAEIVARNPYHGSVVPSGLEASYAHFGMAGLLGFGIGLAYLTMWLHRLLLEAQEESVLASLVSVHLLSLVREMMFAAGFFALGDLFVVTCYRKIVQWTAYGKTPIEPAVLMTPDSP